MVDFRKRLTEKTAGKSLDPLEIYGTLDRESDKGPLRPAQEAILSSWHSLYRDQRDLIVKLHTGQGKTLIGLLILQSKLNEGKGPALYLCANPFLVRQTANQAKQFGIKAVSIGADLPDEFLNSQRILITSVNRLFNGRSKFGLGSRSEHVGSIVLDDSHACVDAIREACMIKLASHHSAYMKLRSLFSEDLQAQGLGSYADMEAGKFEAFLPVPYWAWLERKFDVSQILSKSSDDDEIKFAWPLIKDSIDQCSCVISGRFLHIEPYAPPVSLFGSFSRAENRIFMSATVTNDAFLIKVLVLPQRQCAPLSSSTRRSGQARRWCLFHPSWMMSSTEILSSQNWAGRCQSVNLALWRFALVTNEQRIGKLQAQ